LEDQIRGSRHASVVRRVGLDALFRWVLKMEETEDPQVAREIRQILRSKVGTGSRFLEAGKIIAVLDETRTKGTLTGLVKAMCGEEFSERIGHGYKAARGFTALVLNGFLPETDYYQIRTLWLISVCASVNLMNNANLTEDVRKSVLTEIASILAARPRDCQARLDAIKERIKNELKPVVPAATFCP
jgi:hypothetical protein